MQRQRALAFASATALLALILAPAGAGERCFGAAGMQCGPQPGVNNGLWRAALCSPIPASGAVGGTCGINAGSFRHDECCVRNPNGFLCGGNNSSSACAAEMGIAVSRFAMLRTWKRAIDYRIENSSGTVAFTNYCGRPGARVRSNDANFCCSHAVDMPGWVEHMAFPASRYCH